MASITQRIKAEIISAIPAFLYFCFSFNFLHFIASLDRQPDDIKYYSYMSMTLGALFVSKILIVLNCFSIINAFPKKPLIYNIAWKAFVYNGFILIVRIVETYSRLLYKYDSSQIAYDHVMSQLSSSIFWSTEMCLLFIFMGYIVISEFARVLGREKIKQMVFG